MDDLTDRKKQLEDLKLFTEDIDKKLNEVTSSLGWSVDSLSNVRLFIKNYLINN